MSLRFKSFDTDVREKYPKCVELFNTIEESLTEFELYAPWYASDEERCFMTTKSPLYRTLVIVSCCSLRSIDIINGIISLLNTSNTFNIIFLIRALVENCGILAMFHEQLRLLKESGNYQRFNSKVEKLTLGGKMIGDVVSYNALDLIRAIDSEMSLLDKRYRDKNWLFAVSCG